MKLKHLLLQALLAVSLVGCVAAATGDVHLIQENSDGTYSESRVTATAGNVLAFGSGGTVTSVTPVAASAIPLVRAGTVTVTAALTKAVTFTSAFPAGTTYVVTVITNGLATGGYATSQTVSGFTLTLPIIITGSISYIATPIQ